jgi:H+/Cl- antiporter ClcA
VHIASSVANNLIVYVPMFNRIQDNKAVKLAILEAACAVGVSSTFRAPIGGVLFSIEVTSTYYMVANYWKGFLSAYSALLMSHLIDVVVTMDTEVKFLPVFYVEYPQEAYYLWELPIFVAMGIFLGAAGALSVNSTKYAGRASERASERSERKERELHAATKSLAPLLLPGRSRRCCYPVAGAAAPQPPSLPPLSPHLSPFFCAGTWDGSRASS